MYYIYIIIIIYTLFSFMISMGLRGIPPNPFSSPTLTGGQTPCRRESLPPEEGSNKSTGVDSREVTDGDSEPRSGGVAGSGVKRRQGNAIWARSVQLPAVPEERRGTGQHANPKRWVGWKKIEPRPQP